MGIFGTVAIQSNKQAQQTRVERMGKARGNEVMSVAQEAGAGHTFQLATPIALAWRWQSYWWPLTRGPVPRGRVLQG